MRIKTFVLGGASLAVLAFATPASAQEQQAQTTGTEEAQTTPGEPATPAAEAGDEIVVTGIRRSLQSAQNIRRNSEQIVDAVVAEDIGKLPDLNTAQTAARIPGVQVYRQGGEAQNVLVRGLPNFTTTYNGREIFTAETRVVALQDFPSSNIAALEVFKTSSAELVEPGLAGLINVRSRRPFDFREGQLAGSVWALYTEQAGEVKPNFNLLATKRYDLGDGREWGFLVNVSRTDIRYLDAEISNTDFLQTFNAAGGVLVGNPGAGTVARYPDIQRLFYRSGNRSRPSLNASAQLRVSPEFELYGEYLYQGFRNEIDDRLLAVELFNGAQVSSLQFRPGTNLVRSGTVNTPPGSIFTFQGGTFNTTDTHQFAIGTRWNRDRLSLNIDLARTISTFKGSTESVDRRITRAATVNFNTDRPEFTISGINLADPSEFFFDGLYEQNQRSEGDDYQARLDVEYDVGSPFIRTVQLGARFVERDADRLFADRFRRTATLVNGSALPLDFETFRGVDFGGTTEFTAPTYDSIRDNVEQLRTLVGFLRAPITPNRLFKADERTLSAYGQLVLGTQDLEGIVGIRASKVETRVGGNTPTGIDQIDNGSDDTVFLPNASIRARVSPDLQLRAAVSKTRTLPSFADRNPNPVLNRPANGALVGTPSNPYTTSGGNPFLEAFTSWNLDAAAEYYFGRSSFVSVTGFHRRVDGFIQPSTFDFQDPRLGTIRISGPVNTGEGRISGVEFQGQAFADFESLPDWARGFGVQANVTYIDAEVEQDVSPAPGVQLGFEPITDQLNGVSKWNYNLVGIYERYGFSARLTYNGRSSFRATQQFRGDDIYREFGRPAGRLDLSLNYDLNDQFTVFGDWTNITGDPYRQDLSSARNGAARADFVRYLRYDESTLSAGFRFRFGR